MELDKMTKDQLKKELRWREKAIKDIGRFVNFMTKKQLAPYEQYAIETQEINDEIERRRKSK